jgi:hypothetical protein
VQLFHSARLRASLLATSAISLALLAAPAVVVFAPTSAVAANECGTDPNANGNAADTITCPPGAYPTGITYTTNGNLTLTVKRRPIGTPYRRAKGTPLALMFAVARRRSAEPLAERSA